MLQFFVSYKNSIIHYEIYGSGEKLLLCFHGFGETAKSFAVLESHLSTRYTLVAMDLPLHGETNWNEASLFMADDLLAIIESIPVIGKRNFSVMGFSMGGRVALQLYEDIGGRIEKLILVAPDGLKINFWYHLATQTNWGNRLFKSVMEKPWGFFAFTQILKKASLVNLGVYNYIQRYLKDDAMRNKLYNIWTTMRMMKPDIGVVRSLILKHHTPVIMIYGRYDRVIQFKTGEKFKKGLEPFCTLHLLETGHKLLHEKNSAAIAALL